MNRITFSANAAVYRDNPFDRHLVTDSAKLKLLNGMHSDSEVCSTYIDEKTVKELGITGGRVRFPFDSKREERTDYR